MSTAPRDYFALLGMPRQATLDAEALKLKYHAITRETHPDASPGSLDSRSDSAEINTAYQCLLQPSSRLKHLLLLLAPEEGALLKGGQIPDAFIEIFSRIANATQAADGLISRKKAATSALAQALLSGDEMQAREALEDAGGLVAEQRTNLESECLPAIDAAMASDDQTPAAIASKISEAFRAFGFLDKWQAQVRAKLLELFEAGNAG
ncbi:MAG: curved DNA-binding protein CbpA [Verrucomicrobiales bacterium]|jgi:curved DNA-binding protein CbpA